MSFSRRYEEYMQGAGKGMPCVYLQEEEITESPPLIRREEGEEPRRRWNRRPSSRIGFARDRCSDGAYTPPILKEMSSVAEFFDRSSRKLLRSHSSRILWNFIPMCGREKIERSSGDLVQEAKGLITYSIMNSMAMKRRLENVDAAFKSKARRMLMDISRSPWLFEMMAFCLNESEKGVGENPAAAASVVLEDLGSGSSGECSFVVEEDGKPVLSFCLHELPGLDVDLTCSICLDAVFDPVALKCGHIFCFMCCCRAAKVSTVDGLDLTSRRARCPLCRRAGVFRGAKHMNELSTLLRKRCPEYWRQRRRSESTERVRQAKEHWDLQCRKFIGFI